VTTGTGSGKSLCFFIPIIDSAIRARIGGEAQRTRAIVIYPMNALANSQVSELEKFIDQSELPEQQRPTFARYTGQESQDERERIREAKPDILLTNFMMLELLMTRQNALDRAVIANAHGLDFIVLDELHTYRGRQGADVAMLVRRVRDRLTGALMNAVLLRKGRAQQLSLDFGLSADATAMETKWRDAEEGERRSRARFAQNALKPEEVIPEWKRWRDLLGAPAEVRRFVTRSMSRLDAALEPDRDGTMRAHLAALPMSISERLDARGLEGTVRLAFEEPAPTGAELVTRSHPIPATLAESLLEGALDPGSSPVHALGRVGAWRTAAVNAVTTVALLRLRFKLTVHARRERLLLAEEAGALAWEASSPSISLAAEPARLLLEAPSTGDLEAVAKQRLVSQAMDRIAKALDQSVAAYARERAAVLAQDHARVRSAAAGSLRVGVEPMRRSWFCPASRRARHEWSMVRPWCRRGSGGSVSVRQGAAPTLTAIRTARHHCARRLPP
jgi:hypothetical protein